MEGLNQPGSVELARRGFEIKRVLNRIPELKSIPSNGHIIDVGTGTGIGLKVLKENFPHSHIWGIDIDKQSILEARKLGVTKESNLMVGDAVKIIDDSFNEETFDLITIFELSTTDSKIEDLLNKIKKILKNDGLIIVTGWRELPTIPELEVVRKIEGEIIGSKLEDHLYVFSKSGKTKFNK